MRLKELAVCLTGLLQRDLILGKVEVESRCYIKLALSKVNCTVSLTFLFSDK